MAEPSNEGGLPPMSPAETTGRRKVRWTLNAVGWTVLLSAAAWILVFAIYKATVGAALATRAVSVPAEVLASPDATKAIGDRLPREICLPKYATWMLGGGIKAHHHEAIEAIANAITQCQEEVGGGKVAILVVRAAGEAGLMAAKAIATGAEVAIYLDQAFELAPGITAAEWDAMGKPLPAGSKLWPDRKLPLLRDWPWSYPKQEAPAPTAPIINVIPDQFREYPSPDARLV